METVENTSSIDPFYFDNLVVYEQEKGDDVAYVVRYIPTKDWYNNSKDFNDFTGTIVFYAPNGKKNAIEMITGEMEGSGDTKRRNLEVVCFRNGKWPWFLRGNVYGGGETCTSTYTYT